MGLDNAPGKYFNVNAPNKTYVAPKSNRNDDDDGGGGGGSSYLRQVVQQQGPQWGASNPRGFVKIKRIGDPNAPANNVKRGSTGYVTNVNGQEIPDAQSKGQGIMSARGFLDQLQPDWNSGNKRSVFGVDEPIPVWQRSDWLNPSNPVIQDIPPLDPGLGTNAIQTSTMSGILASLLGQDQKPYQSGQATNGGVVDVFTQPQQVSVAPSLTPSGKNPYAPLYGMPWEDKPIRPQYGPPAPMNQPQQAQQPQSNPMRQYGPPAPLQQPAQQPANTMQNQNGRALPYKIGGYTPEELNGAYASPAPYTTGYNMDLNANMGTIMGVSPTEGNPTGLPTRSGFYIWNGRYYPIDPGYLSKLVYRNSGGGGGGGGGGYDGGGGAPRGWLASWNIGA